MVMAALYRPALAPKRVGIGRQPRAEPPEGPPLPGLPGGAGGEASDGGLVGRRIGGIMVQRYALASEERTDAVALRAMTYNIRGGTFNPLGLEGIARLIERHAPDVVGLQEVDVGRYRTGGVDQPRWLAERLGLQAAFGPSEQYAERNVPAQVGFYGNALLSRFPITASDVHRRPKGQPTDEQRTILACALETNDGPLRAFVTHWGLDPVQRAAQAAATIAFVGVWRPRTPAVLLGDFNAAPDSPKTATVRAVLGDVWDLAAVPLDDRRSFPSGPAGSTTPDGWAGAIDYVFVGAGWTVERIAVVHDEGRASDHNPVLAMLRR